jgi:hypothetical protein
MTREWDATKFDWLLVWVMSSLHRAEAASTEVYGSTGYIHSFEVRKVWVLNPPTTTVAPL